MTRGAGGGAMQSPLPWARSHARYSRSCIVKDLTVWMYPALQRWILLLHQGDGRVRLLVVEELCIMEVFFVIQVGPPTNAKSCTSGWLELFKALGPLLPIPQPTAGGGVPPGIANGCTL